MRLRSVFEYTDYRRFLIDFWEVNKARFGRSFSHANFSKEAGFKNKGFFHTVMHGKRNLSKVSIVKIARAIGLTPTEAEYFENLVFFNQARDLEDRNYFYARMNTVRTPGNKQSRVREVRRNEYEFYAQWYHCAIRSLINLYPYKGDYRWLAKSVAPRIRPLQAKKSVELLEKLGLVRKGPGGVYKITTTSITSGDEIISLAALNFHKKMARLAEAALDKVPGDKRNITGLTLGISARTYETLCEEIRAFRAKIVGIVQQDENPDRTYQLNFQLFPITRTDLKRKGAAK